MNINRHNYEEFFILYMDNELSAADKRAVELFVQENPDLEGELAMLQQTKLIPDNNVSFDNIETLMKAHIDSPVNKGNYEEWFSLYTDNELTNEQKEAVEKFAAANPSIQKELELFQKAKLRPEENIVFPNKESLYRREEKVRVVAIKWWRIAAAAVLLIGFSAVGFMMFNKTTTTDNNSSVATVDPSKVNTVTPSKNAVNDGNASSVEEQTKDINSDALPVEKVTDYANTKSRTVAMQSSLPVKTEKQANPTQATEEVKKTNNLPLPVITEGNVAGNTELAIATPNKTDLINSDENKQPAVTLPADPALNFAKASANNEDVADADQSDKKGSVRGFLRRITRTIEKTTNVKTTDDDDRLLVGGLAIKL